MGERKVVPVSLEQLGARWSERRAPDRTVDLNRVGVPAGAGELPYDFPGFIEVARWMEYEHSGLSHSAALRGWFLRVSLFGFGEVLLSIDREAHSLVVSVGDEEVYTSQIEGAEGAEGDDDDWTFAADEEDVEWE